MPTAQNPDRLEANKALVRRFYEPFNTGDMSTFDDILSPDWQDLPLAPGQGAGPTGFKGTVAGFREAIPDYHLGNEGLVAEGDWVAVRSVATGTHQGAFMGIPATGKRVTLRSMDMHRIENGRIVETHHLEDFLELLMQLGVFPPARQAQAGG